MIVSVASGKGGTGKTLVATSLALSISASNKVQLLDCDVEEPNAHVFLKPVITGVKSVYIQVPNVDESVCNYCGVCARVCTYHAIALLGEHVVTFPQLCHGCGACSYLCPENAIKEEGRACGSVEWGYSDDIEFAHGRLNIGEAMAPPVIRKVKELANDDGIVIVDAPPGTSCPAVESIRGSDFCILVTEPTPFGLNDLMLAVDTVRELAIPFGIVLNRDGIGSTDVELYCSRQNIPIMLRIPLDTEIARHYSKGVTLVLGMPQWRSGFTDVYNEILEIVRERSCCPQR